MCGYINPLLTLLVQGPIVSVIVEFLKNRVPWVKENPQRTVALLNGLAAIFGGVIVCGQDVGQVLAAFVAGFAGSVATHEAVTHPIQSAIDPQRTRLR